MGITPTRADERVRGLSFSEDSFTVELMDGRSITAPLAWFPRLLHATAEQRANWKVSGGGTESTGPTSMRTSPPKVCCAARPRRAAR